MGNQKGAKKGSAAKSAEAEPQTESPKASPKASPAAPPAKPPATKRPADHAEQSDAKRRKDEPVAAKAEAKPKAAKPEAAAAPAVKLSAEHEAEEARLKKLVAQQAHEVSKKCGIPAGKFRLSAQQQAPESVTLAAPAELAKYIDHTVLKADATITDIKKLCAEAKQYGFFSVCVNSSWVGVCREELQGTDVKVCSVVGFPLGAAAGPAKAMEAVYAVAQGATEIDMVINVGKLIAGDYIGVLHDIESVVRAVPSGVLVKVILETCLLSEEQIIDASLLCVHAGAHFVKTSTGFSTGGATIAAVLAMRAAVGRAAQIKASGGVKTYEQAQEYLHLGVRRIGTSSGIALITKAATGKGY